MTMNGPDISSNNTVNLDAISYDFTIIKATEGTSYVNPSCDPAYQKAKAANKRRGIYHFARNSKNSAVAEAQYFYQNVKGYVADGDVVFFLDWEDATSDVAWAKAFLDEFKRLSGKMALIYMSESVVNSFDWSAVASANYGLWVAKYRDMVADVNYDMSQAGPAPSVKYWKFYAMWQWTSAGRLDGYNGNLDCNVFYGDANAWNLYAGGSAPTPSTPAVAVQVPAAPHASVPTYTVVKNDNLSVIGQKTGIAWQTIAAINGIASPFTIFPGQVLRLSDGPAAPQTASTYTVVSGDNLSAIAAVHGTTAANLAKINNIANPNLIFPGQVLRLA